MKCLNCNSEIENGLKFCMECGNPVPAVQNIKCKNCGMDLPLKAKFCFGCGMKIGDSGETKISSSFGIKMGDKNVVAGDVIGEQYKISGNATIVHNDDETKKVLTCHCCGKNIPIVQGFTCQTCGEFVCEDCFDADKGICKDCVSNLSDSKEEQYKEALRTVLSDGKIDIDERRNLNNLQQTLELTLERAKELENEIRYSQIKDALTAIDSFNIDQALDLYYENGKVKEALNLIEPIYKKYPNNEKVLSAYLPIIAEIDSEKAKSTIENLPTDNLQAYLTLIDIYLQNSDFSNAESKIEQTKKIWGNSSSVLYREIIYLYAMYKTTLEEDYLGKVKYLIVNFPVAKTRLEKTLYYKIKSLVDSKDNFFNSEDVYSYFLNKDPFKKAIDEISASVKMVLVQGSEFTMGKNETAKKTSVNDFYIATTQITQELYESVMGENPSNVCINPHNPVESVSFYDALVFCNVLSEKDGLTPCYTVNGTTSLKNLEIPTEADSELWSNVQCDFNANGYRLPTESEWEYAARGGINQKNFAFSGTNTLDSVGWYSVNSGKTTKPVATLSPNQLGVYDMNGNVWEFCWDLIGISRVRRGGSWMNDASMCTVITQSTVLPFRRFNMNGLRVFRTL